MIPFFLFWCNLVVLIDYAQVVLSEIFTCFVEQLRMFQNQKSKSSVIDHDLFWEVAYGAWNLNFLIPKIPVLVLCNMLKCSFGISTHNYILPVTTKLSRFIIICFTYIQETTQLWDGGSTFLYVAVTLW